MFSRALGASSSASTESPSRDAAGLRRLKEVPSIVWSRNDDCRLLLRGLLRLHQSPVRFEATTRAELRELPTLTVPTVLVADADPLTPEWEEELLSVLRDHPELRAVVLLPREGGSLGSEVRAAAPIGLARPFTIRGFSDAVASAAETGRRASSGPT